MMYGFEMLALTKGEAAELQVLTNLNLSIFSV